MSHVSGNALPVPLFVPALFVPAVALFVPAVALFVPAVALFVPAVALFVPTALFVPIELFVTVVPLFDAPLLTTPLFELPLFPSLLHDIKTKRENQTKRRINPRAKNVRRKRV